MLIRVNSVQECDATKADSSTVAGQQKKPLNIRGSIINSFIIFSNSLLQ